jgi:hypothetical protein
MVFGNSFSNEAPPLTAAQSAIALVELQPPSISSMGKSTRRLSLDKVNIIRKTMEAANNSSIAPPRRPSMSGAGGSSVSFSDNDQTVRRPSTHTQQREEWEQQREEWEQEQRQEWEQEQEQEQEQEREQQEEEREQQKGQEWEQHQQHRLEQEQRQQPTEQQLQEYSDRAPIATGNISNAFFGLGEGTAGRVVLPMQSGSMPELWQLQRNREQQHGRQEEHHLQEEEVEEEGHGWKEEYEQAQEQEQRGQMPEWQKEQWRQQRQQQEENHGATVQGMADGLTPHPTSAAPFIDARTPATVRAFLRDASLSHHEKSLMALVAAGGFPCTRVETANIADLLEIGDHELAMIGLDKSERERLADRLSAMVAERRRREQDKIARRREVDLFTAISESACGVPHVEGGSSGHKRASTGAAVRVNRGFNLSGCLLPLDPDIRGNSSGRGSGSGTSNVMIAADAGTTKPRHGQRDSRSVALMKPSSSARNWEETASVSDMSAVSGVDTSLGAANGIEIRTTGGDDTGRSGKIRTQLAYLKELYMQELIDESEYKEEKAKALAVLA